MAIPARYKKMEEIVQAAVPRKFEVPGVAIKANGPLLSVKEKQGRYGTWMSLVLKDTESGASVWFKRTWKEQEAWPLAVGDVIGLTGIYDAPSADGKLFFLKDVKLDVDAPKCVQHTLAFEGEGVYRCASCKSAFNLRPL